MNKKNVFVFCFIIIYSGCYSQDLNKSVSLDSIAWSLQNVEKSRKNLWKKKDFNKAVILIKRNISNLQKLDSLTQKHFTSNLNSNFYNLSCAYSRLNQLDSSLRYLQKSIDLGFNSYYLIKNDSDLINSRNDFRYKLILDKLKNEYDYVEILKQNGTYSKEMKYDFQYSYQNKKEEELKTLRTIYKLDSVAGKGDEVSLITNLMSWVHKAVRHDGNSINPKDRRAIAIIELCRKEKRGVNCRMMATILNDVYLSMGFKSHFVTCLPKNKNDNDCHVINSVYSKKLKKWLWIDPSFETWVKDDKGNLLSIAEVRYRLINNLPVFASSEINWNGKPYSGGGENYLKYYMAKNLFQFQIPLKSCVGFESSNVNSQNKLNDKRYIQLIATEFKPESISVENVYNGVYYTNDSKQFWEQ
jgi:hypothetical protein